ncbi:LacI family DNA-binding transcriptional regulator [Wielerella bovis]|uniref:LacI family DNA-binding transcriptional regulator n=1 Tax=Wielerella bovis TaxID=2917790 RepID=UPI0020190DCF|nr:LacI family DNA-binding transcriptional regulator [Wielerella bovis]ULJ64897.1 LacI family transcriptional regulator [Wielerella bovis]ULJ67170.1 LacI family transcriptional regulator [Wielerella bovis]
MTTIYDVARLAGVSPKTVSRVLNNDVPVKETTREAVEQAIQTLGYIPSSAARALRSQRSGLIGVIMGVADENMQQTDVHGGLPEMFLTQGAQQIAAQMGKTLMIADCGGDSKRVPDLIRQFQQYRAEGIICVSESHQKIRLPFQPNCPVVLLNCFDDAGTPAILPDDENNQRRLTERLIANGHQRIAYITLPTNIVATQQRLQGYRAALWNAGLVVDNALIATGYTDRSNKIDDLWAALNNIMRQPEKPTVICCGNDEMAMRVYGMLRVQGVKIPEEMSIAGFDDHRQIAETLYPALTTVELPYVKMGKRAAELLLQLIHNKQPENIPLQAERIMGEVAWRESVLTRAILP